MEVLLTSRPYWENELVDEMKGLGEFRPTEFRGVFRGQVEDFMDFIERAEREPLLSLSRIIPIDEWFKFSADSAFEEFCRAALTLLDRIDKGDNFGVKVERRGLEKELSSQELAQEVGAFVYNELTERDGAEPTVDLEDPDKLIIFETLRRRGGVGIISKEMRDKCEYLMVP